MFSAGFAGTSRIVNAAGTVTSELRYSPWGEVRHTWGIPPTDYTFTAQYSNVEDFGLMFYQSRWYDPALGRFTSADTLIPGFCFLSPVRAAGEI